MIPVGAPNPGAAYEFLNFIYQPENAAQIAAYVNYTTPVDGVQRGVREAGLGPRRSDLIFPCEGFIEGCSTQPILEGDDASEIEEAWEQVATG